MQWTKSKIISDAYRKLSQENKWLRKRINRLQKQISGSGIGEALQQAFDAARAQEAPETTATNTDNMASGDTCQCPICTARRAIEKAVKEATQGEANMASQPAEAKAPNPYNEVEIIRLNQLVDEVRNRNTELERRLQEASKNSALHPWDQEVPAERGNPLGLTARQVIDSLKDVSKLQYPRISVDYQTDVGKVVGRLFGSEAQHNLSERVQRFLEEALELAQACGFEPQKVRPIVEWVYSRPQGPIDREVGGTMITLAALCSRLGVNLPGVALDELKRLEGKDADEMRGRHRSKPDSIKTVDRNRA